MTRGVSHDNADRRPSLDAIGAARARSVGENRAGRRGGGIGLRKSYFLNALKLKFTASPEPQLAIVATSRYEMAKMPPKSYAIPLNRENVWPNIESMRTSN